MVLGALNKISSRPAPRGVARSLRAKGKFGDARRDQFRRSFKVKPIKFRVASLERLKGVGVGAGAEPLPAL